jgi:transcriptional regulator with XRE-family HTH domain
MIHHDDVDVKKKLMSAVRDLRTALGLSQTEFGLRIGKSLPTIQRWETLRPPDGEALADLERLANDEKYPELAKPFSAALKDVPGHTVFDLDVRPRDRREAFYLAALLRVMRKAAAGDSLSQGLFKEFREQFEQPMDDTRHDIEKAGFTDVLMGTGSTKWRKSVIEAAGKAVGWDAFFETEFPGQRRRPFSPKGKK